MHALFRPGRAAALPDAAPTATPAPQSPRDAADPTSDPTTDANLDWELDRRLMLEHSERRAWWVAAAGMALGLIGIAAVFAQGPLRRVVEVPIVVDRVTGETTVQQRLSEETIPALEALDKHHLAAFVRAREAYSWMFLQRDYDQVARMAVPGVFADYQRQFQGEQALHKRLAASEDWRIHIVGVRLSPAGRRGNRGDATVTYDKTVRQAERGGAETTTRHTASIVYEYQPQVLARERDRIENPLGFVVTAYRSDPEITTVAGGRP